MTLNILPLFEADSTRDAAIVQPPVNPHMYLDGFTINGNLKFIRKIGAGTYGLIYLVENIYTGKQYAAKIILKENSFKPVRAVKDPLANKRYIQQQIFDFFDRKPRHDATCEEVDLELIKKNGVNCPFLREVALHLIVHDHPGVVTIHKVLSLDDLAIVILMDYMVQGDLFANIIENQIFVKHIENQQLLMKNVMLQLIDVIEYCHTKNIYHCDLKPENIMLRYNENYHRALGGPIVDHEEIHIVLIDFGLAMDNELICCNACRGSSFYMAPERITNYNTNSLVRSKINLDQYKHLPCENNVNETNCLYFPTLAGDIWSLGILFINVLCSRNPWPVASIVDNNTKTNDVFKNYMLKENKRILSTILPISNQFEHILECIFQLNPNDRISLFELRENVIDCDFFKDQVMKKPIRQLFTPPLSKNFGHEYEFNAHSESSSESEVNTEEESYLSNFYHHGDNKRSNHNEFVFVEQDNFGLENYVGC